MIMNKWYLDNDYFANLAEDREDAINAMNESNKYSFTFSEEENYTPDVFINRNGKEEAFPVTNVTYNKEKDVFTLTCLDEDTNSTFEVSEQDCLHGTCDVIFVDIVDCSMD